MKLTFLYPTSGLTVYLIDSRTGRNDRLLPQRSRLTAALFFGISLALSFLSTILVRAQSPPSAETPMKDARESSGEAAYAGLTLYDREQLTLARAKAREGEAPYAEAVDSLARRADQWLAIEPPSVMQKKMIPPSGDKHDYYSLGIYWWPNPDTEDGLPYVRKDGVRNPEYANFDGPAIHRMADAVFPLSLAWFYTSDETYAQKAMELLATWFLDPETRMNPHLEYGQAIPGITEGRGIGIIETGALVDVVNGIELLNDSDAMSKQEYRQLREWFSAYTDWLITSENGWDERMWHNNHGSSYDSQVATFALFAGQDSVATMILDSVKVKRIDRQIKADGSQPWELSRTKGMSYSIKNLQHLVENAIIAEEQGIDLWHYQSPEGSSIYRGLAYLVPFYTEGKEFPYQQLGGLDALADRLLELLWIAAPKYEDRLDAWIRNFPGVVPDHSLLHLTYPRQNHPLIQPNPPIIVRKPKNIFDECPLH